jgi:hypothetical protein
MTAVRVKVMNSAVTCTAGGAVTLAAVNRCLLNAKLLLYPTQPHMACAAYEPGCLLPLPLYGP